MESSHGVFIRMLLQRSFPLQHSLRAAQTHTEGDRRGGALHCSTSCRCCCPILAVAAEFPGRVCNMAGQYSRGADKQQLLLATGAVPRQALSASHQAAPCRRRVAGMHQSPCTKAPCTCMLGVERPPGSGAKRRTCQVTPMTPRSHLTLPMQTSSSAPRASSPADWRTLSSAGWVPSRSATPQVLFVFRESAGWHDSDGRDVVLPAEQRPPSCSDLCLSPPLPCQAALARCRVSSTRQSSTA